MRSRSSRPSRPFVLAFALTGALLLSAPASAGGWWSHLGLRGRHLGPGERIQARSEVLFRSSDEADRVAKGAAGPYFVYLIPELDWAMVERAMRKADPGEWWTAPETALRIGTVRVTARDSNLGRVRASFEVPEVAPGRYALMVCDPGCARPLADMVPSEVIVTADAVTAATARKVQRMRSRLHDRQRDLVRRLRWSARAASAARGEAAAAVARVSALEHELRDLRRPPAERRAPSAPGATTGWFVAGIVLGGSLAAALQRRRRDRPERQPPSPLAHGRATASAPHRAAIWMASDAERPAASPYVSPAANESPAP